MDIRSLSFPPSLTLQQCHTWLNQVWPIVRMGTLNLSRALVEVATQKPIEGIPSDKVKSLSKDLVAWGKHNGMWGAHVNGGTTFSLDGVSFLQASLLPRKKPHSAWDEFAKANARRLWLNNAPEHLFPLKVSDVLLFGSMTKPGSVDHGDCDGVLVYEPKSETSLRKANHLFQSAPFAWARPVSNYASYRFVLDKAINDGDRFCRLVSEGNTLDVLFDANDKFATVSIANHQWGVDLYHTQLDEVFDIVQATQTNVDMEQYAHVFASLKAAERRFKGFSLENCARQEVLPLLQNFPKDPKQQNFVVWWAALGGPELLHTLLDHVDADVRQKWMTVIEDIPCIAAVWDESHVAKKNQKTLKSR